MYSSNGAGNNYKSELDFVKEIGFKYISDPESVAKTLSDYAEGKLVFNEKLKSKHILPLYLLVINYVKQKRYGHAGLVLDFIKSIMMSKPRIYNNLLDALDLLYGITKRAELQFEKKSLKMGNDFDENIEDSEDADKAMTLLVELASQQNEKNDPEYHQIMALCNLELASYYRRRFGLCSQYNIEYITSLYFANSHAFKTKCDFYTFNISSSELSSLESVNKHDLNFRANILYILAEVKLQSSLLIEEKHIIYPAAKFKEEDLDSAMSLYQEAYELCIQLNEQLTNPELNKKYISPELNDKFSENPKLIQRYQQRCADSQLDVANFYYRLDLKDKYYSSLQKAYENGSIKAGFKLLKLFSSELEDKPITNKEKLNFYQNFSDKIQKSEDMCRLKKMYLEHKTIIVNKNPVLVSDADDVETYLEKKAQLQGLNNIKDMKSLRNLLETGRLMDNTIYISYDSGQFYNGDSFYKEHIDIILFKINIFSSEVDKNNINLLISHFMDLLFINKRVKDPNIGKQLTNLLHKLGKDLISGSSKFEKYDLNSLLLFYKDLLIISRGQALNDFDYINTILINLLKVQFNKYFQESRNLEELKKILAELFVDLANNLAHTNYHIYNSFKNAIDEFKTFIQPFLDSIDIKLAKDPFNFQDLINIQKTQKGEAVFNRLYKEYKTSSLAKIYYHRYLTLVKNGKIYNYSTIGGFFSESSKKVFESELSGPYKSEAYYGLGELLLNTKDKLLALNYLFIAYKLNLSLRDEILNIFENCNYKTDKPAEFIKDLYIAALTNNLNFKPSDCLYNLNPEFSIAAIMNIVNCRFVDDQFKISVLLPIIKASLDKQEINKFNERQRGDLEIYEVTLERIKKRQQELETVSKLDTSSKETPLISGTLNPSLEDLKKLYPDKDFNLMNTANGLLDTDEHSDINREISEGHLNTILKQASAPVLEDQPVVEVKIPDEKAQVQDEKTESTSKEEFASKSENLYPNLDTLRSDLNSIQNSELTIEEIKRNTDNVLEVASNEASNFVVMENKSDKPSMGDNTQDELLNTLSNLSVPAEDLSAKLVEFNPKQAVAIAVQISDPNLNKVNLDETPKMTPSVSALENDNNAKKDNEDPEKEFLKEKIKKLEEEIQNKDNQIQILQSSSNERMFQMNNVVTSLSEQFKIMNEKFEKLEADKNEEIKNLIKNEVKNEVGTLKQQIYSEGSQMLNSQMQNMANQFDKKMEEIDSNIQQKIQKGVNEAFSKLSTKFSKIFSNTEGENKNKTTYGRPSRFF